jgi:HSP20 family protein
MFNRALLTPLLVFLTFSPPTPFGAPAREERRIIMNVRDLVPWTRDNDRERNLPVTQDAGSSPLFTLHREMNRLFDDVFRGFDTPRLWGGGAWPQLEVQDTDKEYRVTAELPGLEEKDVEVLFEDGVLVLRGEKRAETEERARAFSERVYGRFERRLTLGDIDEDRIQARFRNGVLTVTAPKSPQSQARVKRIPINGGATSH